MAQLEDIPLDKVVGIRIEPDAEPERARKDDEEYESSADDSYNQKPSLRLGRSLSLKNKSKKKIQGADDEPPSDGNFKRNAVTYRSLPHNHSRTVVAEEDPTKRMRRSCSLPRMSAYESWEGLTRNTENLKKSSQRLEDRIARQ